MAEQKLSLLRRIWNFCWRCIQNASVVGSVTPAGWWHAIAALIGGTAVMLHAYLNEHFSLSIAICLGLFAWVCWLCLLQMAANRRWFNGDAASNNAAVTSTDTMGDEVRLIAARIKIREAASLARTIHANTARLKVNGVDIGPPDWTVETKAILRVILRPDIYSQYESILKKRNPRSEAVAFLEALASTLTHKQLSG